MQILAQKTTEKFVDILATANITVNFYDIFCNAYIRAKICGNFSAAQILLKIFTKIFVLCKIFCKKMQKKIRKKVKLLYANTERQIVLEIA